MIVFLLSGLWHGADWSFVAWGAYHGLLLVLLILLNRNTKYEHVVAYDKWFPSLMEIGQMVLVFALATFGWIIFRADTIGQAWEFVCGICHHSIFSMPQGGATKMILVISMTILMLLIEWLQRDKKHGLDIAHLGYKSQLTIYILLTIVVFVFGATSEKFIYFQF